MRRRTIRLLLLITVLLVTLCDGRNSAAQQTSSVMLFGLDFSPDGSLVVLGGDAMRVLDVKTGALKQRLALSHRTTAVAFSTTADDLIAAGGDDAVVRLCDVSKPKPVRELVGHSGRVSSVCFSPDGKLLASTAYRIVDGRRALGELRLWNTKTGTLLRSLKKDAVGLSGVVFSPDGKRLAFCEKPHDKTATATIGVCAVDTLKPLRTIPCSPGIAMSVSFMPDGKKLIIAGGVCVPTGPNSCQPTGKIWFADPNSDKPADLLPTQPCSYFHPVSLTPKGDRFATGTSTVRYRFNAEG